MERQTITYAQYLQLVGLLALATRYNDLLRELERAAAAIVHLPPEGCSPDYFGHVSDAIYGDESVDSLLKRLRMTVVPPADAARPEA